ncbi:hypothetical protein [Nocardia crassostreae]|uniref:hypothetical protein n=1 Tax=Nocardia crassostreae TaxID=53428 RepID=UPI000830065B|nr:hypothetical protein [Nocardia crassostreae]
MIEPSDEAHAKAHIAAAKELILALPDGKEFINAEIEKLMSDNAWAELSEKRHMGGVYGGLHRRGDLQKVDTQATPARSHGGLTTVWRRTCQGP